MFTKLSMPMRLTSSPWHAYSSANEWMRVPNSITFFSSEGRRALNMYLRGHE